MPQTDADCVRGCLDGHPEGYRHLVSRHERGLRAYLVGRQVKEGEAEEVAQEAFVRGYLSLGKLRRPERFFAWLVGIAEHVMLERHRRRRREAQLAEDLSTLGSGLEAPGTREDADEEMQRAIASLPEATRQVILLRYYANLRCGEIADQLGMPLGTVTKTLSRAYALLREALQEQPRRTEDGRKEVRQ
jgi:RNA polymerase sigma-70 factor (ECF subfamily)